ncbi:MAG: type II toxin-antitoxin system VapC family toxin [Actinomycetota bacterium]|nr:type II toxin-antitoxin system VapC family toxin [Actinomycetota bacterium]
MIQRADATYYWDASAVLSALFSDEHSPRAVEWARLEGVHLMSSLCLAEVNAVIERIRRERKLGDVLVEAAREALHSGPWRRLELGPRRGCLESLPRRWPLRGADLWHLATAHALREELGEIYFLAFDTRLVAASQGEGLGVAGC